MQFPGRSHVEDPSSDSLESLEESSNATVRNVHVDPGASGTMVSTKIAEGDTSLALLLLADAASASKFHSKAGASGGRVPLGLRWVGRVEPLLTL